MTGNWKSVVRLEPNKQGRDFVCGDIHGCFDDLEDELKKIAFDKTADRLFCVGDLIDRGPQSELATQYMAAPWFFTVMGNHEYMFLMATLDTPLQKSNYKDHLANGGQWAYEIPNEETNAMLDEIDKLPLVIQVGDTIITHACLPEIKSLEEIEKNPLDYMETILWHRGEYPPVKIPGITRVFVGHTPLIEPKQYGKHINIDTGAFGKHRGKQGKLTVISLYDTVDSIE